MFWSLRYSFVHAIPNEEVLPRQQKYLVKQQSVIIEFNKSDLLASFLQSIQNKRKTEQRFELLITWTNHDRARGIV